MGSDLFGSDRPQPKRERQAHRDHAHLIRLHGAKGNLRCKGCLHLQRHSFAKDYLKCGKATITGGAGTDWRANWQACGLFQAGESEPIWRK